MRKYIMILMVMASVHLMGQSGITINADGSPLLYTVEGDLTVNGEVSSDIIHLFAYFGDSAYAFSVTTDWQHVTNATDSIFIYMECEGFTVSNDTITFLTPGDFDMVGKLTFDGDNSETQSVRFYNITQAKGIPVAGAVTSRGANNFESSVTHAYASGVAANDKIVMQMKADANGTCTFKNGLIKIFKVHK